MVWLNPYWGPVLHDGKTFEGMKAYTANKDRVKAIIRVPELAPDTFGLDYTEMLRERLTFAEALEDSTRSIMTRQRLKIIRDKLYQQLDTAGIL